MRHYDSDRVDLRSDTVTQPTPSMREAMNLAIVVMMFWVMTPQ